MRRRRAALMVTFVGVVACAVSAAGWARPAPAMLHPSGVVGTATMASLPSIRWSAPELIGLPHTARDGLVAVRCPTTSLCVALDDAGDILTSRNPGAAVPVWKRAHVDRGLSAIACPSASLCVAVDSRGNALTSTRRLSRGL